MTGGFLAPEDACGSWQARWRWRERCAASAATLAVVEQPQSRWKSGNRRQHQYGDQAADKVNVVQRVSQ
ncbi:MAG: hypothetical protein WB624_00670, partial [Xanthobacteraceae bacterium]